MSAKKVKFRDFVKVEFKDSIRKIYEKDVLHIYSANLACSKAVQVGFDYSYDIIDSEHLTKTIYLKDYGEIRFIIDIKSDEAIVSPESYPVMRNFLDNYSVDSDVPSMLD